MKKVLKQLKNAKHIWLYGAGIVGKRVLEMSLKDVSCFSIEGVVVSKLSQDQDNLLGYKVIEIENIKTPADDNFFIIAASEKYQKEIICTLESKGYYHYLIWKNEYRWLLANFQFQDRCKDLSKVCFVLSGYKSFLWKDVFDRLYKFVPDDVEVCILSSGVFNEELSAIAQKNDWSYLSTELNNITLIQNIAFLLYDQAQWIYKMDEDIFLTKNCFENLMKSHVRIEKKEPYKAGFVAPLIPVNGYGYIRILNYVNKLEEYEQQFGRALYGGNIGSPIEMDERTAEFMWGKCGELPYLDKLNDMFSKNEAYSICGVRFSIGFILFHRSVWEGMGGFSTSEGIGLGVDEIEIAQYCIARSLVMVVAENTVVGHFSFGQQTEGMKKIYKECPELFQIRQVEQ